MKTSYYLCIGKGHPMPVEIEAGHTPRPGQRLQTNHGLGPVIDVVDVHYGRGDNRFDLAVQIQAELA